MKTVDLEIGHPRWHQSAICKRASDPEIFFPEPSDAKATAAVINDYCDVCPLDVKDACLADALTYGKQYGIRGGLSETERTALLAKQRRTERKEEAA